MNRRIGFFLGAALLCFLLVPVLDPKFRWVPKTVGVVYVVLAVLAGLDLLGRRKP